jgi:hypothetical protein
MGDAEDLEILLKAAEITRQMHRDIRKFGWLKTLVCGIITGTLTLVGAGWCARAYIESIREGIRSEIRPMRIQQEEMGQRLARLEGALKEHTKQP